MTMSAHLETVEGFASRHALLLIVALGAVLRFATLGTQSFWLDEHATLDVISSDGVIDLLRGVQAGESNPPLYYLLAGAWKEVFGSTEVGVRSLSAVLGTATIPVVYGAASALATRRAGLIAAALTATAPILIWYSQESRNYALLVFLVALAFLCFVRALEDRGHRWLLGWAIASSLALTTHYFAFALIVPEAVWLFARGRGSRLDTALAVGVVAAVGTALLPRGAGPRGPRARFDH
jgi:mannosyltransferase